MIENLENEQWLSIDGYDGYEVSNYGRVKSLGNDKTRKEKILKQSTNKYGYQIVGICKGGKQKMFRVHRLVAMAFIPNLNNYEQVNHKDEVKTNNHVDNLEWCDCKYNINYGNRNERQAKAMIGKFGKEHPMFGKFGKDNPKAKQVIQLTLDNQFVKTWGSIIDVERKLGYDNGYISKCCKGKLPHAYKYKWCYA